MSGKCAIVNVLGVAVLNWSIETAGHQGLEAKLAGTKLPSELFGSSAVYDGVDNIYILGG
jgi:hypothetical protein